MPNFARARSDVDGNQLWDGKLAGNWQIGSGSQNNVCVIAQSKKGVEPGASRLQLTEITILPNANLPSPGCTLAPLEDAAVRGECKATASGGGQPHRRSLTRNKVHEHALSRPQRRLIAVPKLNRRYQKCPLSISTQQ